MIPKKLSHKRCTKNFKAMARSKPKLVGNKDKQCGTGYGQFRLTSLIPFQDIGTYINLLTYLMKIVSNFVVNAFD